MKATRGCNRRVKAGRLSLKSPLVPPCGQDVVFFNYFQTLVSSIYLYTHFLPKILSLSLERWFFLNYKVNQRSVRDWFGKHLTFQPKYFSLFFFSLMWNTEKVLTHKLHLSIKKKKKKDHYLWTKSIPLIWVSLLVHNIRQGYICAPIKRASVLWLILFTDIKMAY